MKRKEKRREKRREEKKERKGKGKGKGKGKRKEKRNSVYFLPPELASPLPSSAKVWGEGQPGRAQDVGRLGVGCRWDSGNVALFSARCS